MTATHSVTVETDDDGTAHSHTFTCTGTAADECHQWCSQGCDESCPGPATHRWEDTGECRILVWYDALDVSDTYADSEDDPWPNRSGRIEDEWTGDGYIWRYRDDAPTEAAA